MRNTFVRLLFIFRESLLLHKNDHMSIHNCFYSNCITVIKMNNVLCSTYINPWIMHLSSKCCILVSFLEGNIKGDNTFNIS